MGEESTRRTRWSEAQVLQRSAAQHCDREQEDGTGYAAIPSYLPLLEEEGWRLSHDGKESGRKGEQLEQPAAAEASAQPQIPLLCTRGPSLAHLLPIA